MANKRTTVDLTEVMAGLDRLAGMKESLARTMGAAMGEVVRDEAKERAPVLDPSNRGADDQTPGLLKRSIYLAYDERRNVINRDSYRYTVSWNSRLAPHGHLLEFGHWMPYAYAWSASHGYYTPKSPLVPLPGNGFHVDAHPFLGPAFDAKQPTLHSIAISAGTRRFTELTT